MAATTDFEYWNGLSKPAVDTFLANDWDNPARARAAEIIKGWVAAGAVSLVEVGPGPGIDYDRFLSKIGDLKYTAFEGSKNLRDNLVSKFPGATFHHGTFADLPDKGFDIAYTKATFEHQPDFEEPLKFFLRSTRRFALINWYRPPTIAENREYSHADKMHYNTYLKSTVNSLIHKEGFSLEEERCSVSGNVLYRCARRP